MENQEEKETSLEYFYQRIIINFEFNSDAYISIQSALNEAKKMYKEEIEKAFEKGCLKGYKDHVNLINTLNK